MQQHQHNTRFTPEKRQRGCAREGAGRPPDKENVDPNHASRLSLAREHRREHQKAAADYKEQQTSWPTLEDTVGRITSVLSSSPW